MLHVIHFGVLDYEQTYHKMRQQIAYRANNKDILANNELWVLEHYPVFTQGQAGKAEHILNSDDIAVIQTDRGGQVTYHGPGQLVVYFLLNLKQLNLGTRELVTKTENSLIDCLQQFNVSATSRADAPGVYVQERKIASLGFRIKQGFSYHGLALNVDMDLQPFLRINPCGFQKMQMTQLVAETTMPVTLELARQTLLQSIGKTFKLAMKEMRA